MDRGVADDRNPILDDHLTGMTLIVLALTTAGTTWGLGAPGGQIQPVVQRGRADLTGPFHSARLIRKRNLRGRCHPESGGDRFRFSGR